MPLLSVPFWIWAGTGVAALPIAAVIVGVAWELRSRRPSMALNLRGTRFELWCSRRLPRTTDLVVVPVAPDLKLIAGSALWVRGVTAGHAQREADALAPREPGDAVVVAGARYRFARTGLAVVLDRRKQYSPDAIRDGIRRAVALAAERSISSVTIPDWSPDLMRQPRAQNMALRLSTAAEVAPMLVDAAMALAGQVHCVRIWVQHPEIAEVYRSAIAAHAAVGAYSRAA